MTSWRFNKLAELMVTGVGIEGQIGAHKILRQMTGELQVANYEHRLWERLPVIDYRYE